MHYAWGALKGAAQEFTQAILLDEELESAQGEDARHDTMSSLRGDSQASSATPGDPIPLPAIQYGRRPLEDSHLVRSTQSSVEFSVPPVENGAYETRSDRVAQAPTRIRDPAFGRTAAFARFLEENGTSTAFEADKPADVEPDEDRREHDSLIQRFGRISLVTGNPSQLLKGGASRMADLMNSVLPASMGELRSSFSNPSDLHPGMENDSRHHSTEASSPGPRVDQSPSEGAPPADLMTLSPPEAPSGLPPPSSLIQRGHGTYAGDAAQVEGLSRSSIERTTAPVLSDLDLSPVPTGERDAGREEPPFEEPSGPLADQTLSPLPKVKTNSRGARHASLQGEQGEGTPAGPSSSMEASDAPGWDFRIDYGESASISREEEGEYGAALGEYHKPAATSPGTDAGSVVAASSNQSQRRATSRSLLSSGVAESSDSLSHAACPSDEPSAVHEHDLNLSHADEPQMSHHSEWCDGFMGDNLAKRLPSISSASRSPSFVTEKMRHSLDLARVGEHGDTHEVSRKSSELVFEELKESNIDLSLEEASAATRRLPEHDRVHFSSQRERGGHPDLDSYARSSEVRKKLLLVDALVMGRDSAASEGRSLRRAASLPATQFPAPLGLSLGAHEHRRTLAAVVKTLDRAAEALISRPTPERWLAVQDQCSAQTTLIETLERKVEELRASVAYVTERARLNFDKSRSEAEARLRQVVQDYSNQLDTLRRELEQALKDSAEARAELAAVRETIQAEGVEAENASAWQLESQRLNRELQHWQTAHANLSEEHQRANAALAQLSERCVDLETIAEEFESAQEALQQQRALIKECQDLERKVRAQEAAAEVAEGKRRDMEQVIERLQRILDDTNSEHASVVAALEGRLHFSENQARKAADRVEELSRLAADHKTQQSLIAELKQKLVSETNRADTMEGQNEILNEALRKLLERVHARAEDAEYLIDRRAVEQQVKEYYKILALQGIVNVIGSSKDEMAFVLAEACNLDPELRIVCLGLSRTTGARVSATRQQHQLSQARAEGSSGAEAQQPVGHEDGNTSPSARPDEAKMPRRPISALFLDFLESEASR